MARGTAKRVQDEAGKIQRRTNNWHEEGGEDEHGPCSSSDIVGVSDYDWHNKRG